MTEIVEKAMEDTAEEAEEMKRNKLFTEAEVREILTKRKNFEYRIASATRTVDDFQEYISFENIVLCDIKSRRNKLRIGDKRSSLDKKVRERIIRIYEEAVEKFPSDYDLSMSYFRFCEWYGFSRTASSILEHLLTTFSYIPEIWKIATGWYVKKDVNEGFNTLHKGLVLHRGNQMLYLEAIKLVLAVFPNEKEKLKCDKIEMYINEIFRDINDFSYILKLLPLLRPHEYTIKLQESIIRWLLASYSNEVIVWDAVAKREKEGLHYGIRKECILNTEEFRLERCALKYAEAFKTIKAEKKQTLWCLYLDCFMTEWEQEKSPTTVKYARDIVLKAFETTDCVLPEKYYVTVSTLLGVGDKSLEIICRGIEKYPESVDLWKSRLKFPIHANNHADFDDVFKRGVSALKEKSLALWMIAIKFYCLTVNENTVKKIFEEGMKQPPLVSDTIKGEYIRWLIVSSSMATARKFYNQQATQEPYCEKLHQAMLKHELLFMNIDSKVEHLHNVYKLLCQQFGHNNTEHYVNLINFYIQYQQELTANDKNFNLQEKLDNLLKEAEIKFKDAGAMLLQFHEKLAAIKSQTLQNCVKK